MKYLKNKKGQAMVEFALSIGLLLFLVGTIFAGNMLMHDKSVITLASYEASRQYSGFTTLDIVKDNDFSKLASDKKDMAKKQAQSLIDRTAIGFKYNNDSKDKNALPQGIFITDISKGNNIYTQTTIRGTVKLMWPMLDPFNPTKVVNSMIISNTYTMKKENGSKNNLEENNQQNSDEQNNSKTDPNNSSQDNSKKNNAQ